jgi:hypothetical protein
MGLYHILAIIIVLTASFFLFVFVVIMRVNFKRTLNLSFLRVTLPKKESDLDEKKETTKDFKEMVGLMEQLLASLKSIYSSKIISRII